MTLALNDPTLLRSQAFIEGVWVGGTDTAITNPATGEVVSHVPEFGATEAETAVLAPRSLQTLGKAAGERSVPQSCDAGSI